MKTSVQPKQNNGTSRVQKSPDSAIKADPSLPIIQDESVGEWAAKISTALSKSCGWAIEAGQELTKAKKALGHGHWTKLFESGRLRLSVRTAELLMKVGSHPYFQISKNLSNLPMSYLALHELSHLGPEAIELGVESGAIGPEMTIKKAKCFVRDANDSSPNELSAPFDPEKRMENLRRRLTSEAEQWPEAQRPALIDFLATLVAELRSETEGINHNSVER
jgi:hypothetical protein